MRPNTTDTSPGAEEAQLELDRPMPPADRALKALRMTTWLIGEYNAAIAWNYPELPQ